MSASSEDPSRPSPTVPWSVIVRGRALTALEDHMRGDTAAEFGGVLIGTVSPEAGLVTVTAAVAVESNDSESTSFTITRAVWDQLVGHVIRAYPGQQIVGWYHSHPRFGIFLSSHDLFIHSTFFSLPWQFAYVFDPVEGGRGFFGWADGEIVRVPGWEVTSVERGVGAGSPVNAPAHGAEIGERLAGSQRAEPQRGAAQRATATAAYTTPPLEAPPVVHKPAGQKRRLTTTQIVLAAAALLAIVVLGIIVFGGGDDEPASSAFTTTQSSASSASETSIAGGPVTSVIKPAPEITGLATMPPTTVPAAVTTTVVADTASTEAEPTTTAAVVPVQPATPTDAQPPAARVGNGSVPCGNVATGSYSVEGTCFVPLSNGNIVIANAGTLTCADPAGTEIATGVAVLNVGIDDDANALFANGIPLQRCDDLTYARNVLAGGAPVRDGLCAGGNATPIDPTTTRCFAQHPETGAIVALIAGGGNPANIVAACFNAGNPAGQLLAPLWTKQFVDSTWRVVSVTFDPGTGQFIGKATRNGVPTTTPLECA